MKGVPWLVPIRGLQSRRAADASAGVQLPRPSLSPISLSNETVQGRVTTKTFAGECYARLMNFAANQPTGTKIAR